jgi:hypothetical protein
MSTPAATILTSATSATEPSACVSATHGPLARTRTGGAVISRRTCWDWDDISRRPEHEPCLGERGLEVGPGALERLSRCAAHALDELAVDLGTAGNSPALASARAVGAMMPAVLAPLFLDAPSRETRRGNRRQG